MGFKISDEHPRLFHMGVPRPPRDSLPLNYYIAWSFKGMEYLKDFLFQRGVFKHPRRKKYVI